MSQPFQTPPIVKLLGYGGLIPFIGLALLTFTSIVPAKIIESALLYYAAIILSFIAALHWGFAMSLKSLTEKQRNSRYVWSVIPPLLAWFSIMIDPTTCALILITSYLANLWQDISFDKLVNVDLPNWYIPLRIRLTTGAVICIATLALNQ